MTKPYALMTFVEIRQILNRRATGEEDLLQQIEEIDADSIYYHTHSFYLRAKYQHERYPNDFATWVAEHVRDRVLSERLAMVDPFAVSDVEALRRKIAILIEDHLRSLRFSPRALFGDPFDFMLARVIPVPAGREVRSEEELREALATASPEVLYFHFFEDAFRRGRRTGSLVAWVAEELRHERLSREMALVNPYRLHMEQLRRDLLQAFDRAGREA